MRNAECGIGNGRRNSFRVEGSVGAFTQGGTAAPLPPWRSDPGLEGAIPLGLLWWRSQFWKLRPGQVSKIVIPIVRATTEKELALSEAGAPGPGERSRASIAGGSMAERSEPVKGGAWLSYHLQPKHLRTKGRQVQV
jgi:hypothetical protein